MIRVLMAMLVSISLSLPGAVMASVDHHQHLKAEAPADGHQHEHEHRTHVIEAKGEESAGVPMCCHLMAEHCISAGVLLGTPWAFNPHAWVQGALKIAGDVRHHGQNFEADPPPPRT